MILHLNNEKKILSLLKTMTASKYREFLSIKTNPLLKVKNSELFSFTLFARHRRTNECDSGASMGKRGAYKNTINKAADDYSLLNRKYLKIVLPSTPSVNVEMYIISYNPKSRDNDGNSVTLKYLRDILTNLNFIKKDRKEVYLKLKDK